jgi:D-threo-aldose 1-dehydrogenase
MIRKRLGSSNVMVTALGLGTAQFGDLYESFDQQRATAIVDRAWEGGIRYFDTAPHYGLGLAEKRLGVALASRVRSDYVISSKVGRLIVPDEQGTLRRQWDFSASGIARSLDESLSRLGLDRLDLALIHDPQEHLSHALDHAYPALDDLRSEGVVGAIGVGTGDLRALSAFATATDIDAIMIAGRYTLLEQPAYSDVLPAAREAGISILNAGVFNSGLLATRHPGIGSRYEYATVPSDLLAKAQRIAELAESAGTTLPQAALRFASQDPAVASVVIGADTSEHVTRNISLFEEPRPMGDLWTALKAQELLPAAPAPQRSSP